MVRGFTICDIVDISIEDQIRALSPRFSKWEDSVQAIEILCSIWPNRSSVVLGRGRDISDISISRSRIITYY